VSAHVFHKTHSESEPLSDDLLLLLLHVLPSPELFALHLQQWLSFFGNDEPSTTTNNNNSSSSSSSSVSGLRARLAASPQLLAVDAEQLVGNLYELGAMLQAEVSWGWGC
jgi:hypothetical protein